MDLDSNGIVYRWHEIGPSEAAEILRRCNSANRPVHVPVMERMARDMLGGRWVCNGNPIQFTASPEERLLDGQHRLDALVEAGKTNPNIRLRFAFAHNVPAAAFSVINATKPTSGADVLSLAGYHATNLLAAATRSVLAYIAAGQARDRPSNIYANRSFTPGEILAYVRDHQNIVVGAEEADSMRRAWPAMSPPSIMAATIHLSADQYSCVEFLRSVVRGSMLEDGSPALTLRNWLALRQMDRRSLPPHVIWATVIRAVNAASKGVKLKHVKFNMGDKFPLILM